MTTLELMWGLFWVVVISALFLDLFILNKHKGHVSIKEAAVMVCCWVALALSFGGVIFYALGHQKGLEYLTGYVMEYSLSIDNMFVFIMIFGYFAIPRENQPKALIWGILGAVVLRFIFIFVGVELIEKFSWMIYVFGGLLIITAVKMFFDNDNEEKDISKNIAFRLLKKLFPFKADYKGSDFFVKENTKRFATPLLAAVFVIEMSDVIFAVDSIPAVLSITHDPFIVYTSNIFAIIGLRSLYFLLNGIAGKFAYLKYGISVILLFVGFKMMAHSFVKIPTLASLGVILFILILSIAASSIWPPKEQNNA